MYGTWREAVLSSSGNIFSRGRFAKGETVLVGTVNAKNVGFRPDDVEAVAVRNLGVQGVGAADDVDNNDNDDVDDIEGMEAELLLGKGMLYAKAVVVSD